MDEIYNLFIGGGEPFLRPDLAAIFLCAARINHVANLFVPTNGQHTTRVVETLEAVLPSAAGMRFHLNLSVDHTDPGEHDRIRGKARAYERLLSTLDAVQPLRRRFPNLILHTLTTVMKDNQHCILKIYEELRERFRPDGISFNLCRGNSLDPAQTDIDPEVYRALAERMEADYQAGRLRVSGVSAYGTANHLLDQHVRRTVERTIVTQRAQFSCVSGRLAAVIYSNGDVVECEMKNSRLGNLRDVDYDFRRLWFTERAREVARDAAKSCFCTHECGHYSSAIYSFPVVVKIAAQAIATERNGRTSQGGSAP
jgi:MoaA/NifB/PqqE/SkfB family radical SAM enzyme